MIRKGRWLMSMKSKVLIVNALTVLRLIGAIMIPLIFSFVNIPLLIGLLVFLFLTDFLDGFLARRWKAYTVGGSLLDPLSDKLLAISCLIALWKTKGLFGWLLLGELLIALINLIRFSKGENDRPTGVGKVKTWGLSITMILGAIDMFKHNLSGVIEVSIYVFFAVTIILDVITICIYVKKLLSYKAKDKRIDLKNISIKKFLKRVFDSNLYEQDKNRTILELLRK